jgi:ribonuclease HI
VSGSIRRATVHTDGGARGNPGPAAIAAVISDGEGGVISEHAELIGKATNNVAEYRAVLLGIEQADGLDIPELDIVCDSELVVRQLMGQYKVKDAALRELHGQALSELESFDAWSIRHVRREQNARADALVNEALDAAPRGADS